MLKDTDASFRVTHLGAKLKFFSEKVSKTASCYVYDGAEKKCGSTTHLLVVKCRNSYLAPCGIGFLGIRGI